MNVVTINEIKLIGLALKTKTINANGQSHTDCQNLWYSFDKAGYAGTIPNKLSNEIFGVYFDYEGDSTQPFNYFIGCKVATYAAIPDALESLTIPAGNYHKIVVTGKMPDCMNEAWKKI